MGRHLSEPAAGRSTGPQLGLWQTVCARGLRRRSAGGAHGRHSRLHAAVPTDAAGGWDSLYGHDADGAERAITLQLASARWLTGSGLEHAQRLRLGGATGPARGADSGAQDDLANGIGRGAGRRSGANLYELGDGSVGAIGEAN